MKTVMQLGPHQASCLLEFAYHMPGTVKGVRPGSRQAVPLLVRRVKRTVSSVFVPESTEVVNEMVEDLSLQLLDATVLVGLVTLLVCVALVLTARTR